MAVAVVALVVLGVMCGSEFNIAAFGHPALNRQPLDAHIRMRSHMAALFGRIMPFWMIAALVLNLLLLLHFEHLSATAWRLAAAAAGIQILMVVFSLAGPVPINNRIIQWTPESLPSDWRAREARWDLYHWIRTIFLIGAFALLAISLGIR